MTDDKNSVSLREHFETQLAWLDRHFDSQVNTIDSNTVKALAQLDKRLEGMNEFRDALRDQSGRLLTRIESAAQHDALEARMKSLELNRAAGEGKMLMVSAFIAFISSIVVVVIANWAIK